MRTLATARPLFPYLRELRPYLARYRGQILRGYLCILFQSAAVMAIPWLTLQAIDGLRGGADSSFLLRIAGWMLAASAFAGVFLFLKRQILIGVSREIEFDLRNDFFDHLQALSASFYQRHRTGDLMARASNDLNAVRDVVGPGLMYGLTTATNVAAAGSLMFRLDPALSVATLLPFPLMAFVVSRMAREVHHRSRRVQEQYGALSNAAQENIAGIRVVQAYGREEAEKAHFAGVNEDYLEANLALARYRSFFQATIALLLGAGGLLLLWVGGARVISGAVSLGELVAFMGYLSQLTWPFVAIGWVISMIERGEAAMQRILQIMRQEPEIRSGPGQGLGLSVHRSSEAPRSVLPRIGGRADPPLVATASGSAPGRAPGPALGRASGPVLGRSSGLDPTSESCTARPPLADVVFEGVSFAYGDGPLVLHDVHLHVPAGQRLGIAGRTGSGKSTLVQLLARLHDPTRGRILLNGRDIRDLDLAEVRRTFAFVPQDPFLFSDLLRENIRFGRLDATPEEIAEAAAQARLEDDLRAFSHGLDTPVGERGVTLSGGQRQRVAIARAFLKDAPVLVLDDALSSVDKSTESILLENLRRRTADRTLVLIGHRVSTLQTLDRVLFLEEGRIVEEGTPGQLLSRGGRYADLARRQRLTDELEATGAGT